MVESVDDVMRACERVWHRLGVPADVSADMAGELRADLTAAAADGVAPMTLVGGDPAGFARAWASARGVVRGRRRPIRVGVATVIGALPGALAGLFVAYGLSSTAFAQLFRHGPTHTSSATIGAASHTAAGSTIAAVAGEVPDPYLTVPGWLLLLLYVAGGVLAYVGAVAAVSAALRAVGDPARHATVRRLRYALPIGGTLGVMAAVVYAGTTAYSTAWPNPGIEAALVVVCVVTTAVAARRSPHGDEASPTLEPAF